MAQNQIGVRISAEVKAALDRVTDRERDPYAPTVTQIVERGILLAVQELYVRRNADG